MYTGDDCELGYAASCRDIVENGGTISGHYNIKLHHDQLTEPCSMKEDTSYDFWKTKNPFGSIDISEYDCKEQCLSDADCTFVLHMDNTDSGELFCYINTGLGADEVLPEHDIDDPAFPFKLFTRDCPEAQELHCNLTDPDYPVLSIISKKANELLFLSSDTTDGHYLVYKGLTTEQFTILTSTSYCTQTLDIRCPNDKAVDWKFISGQDVTFQLESPRSDSDSWCQCALTESCSIDGDQCYCYHKETYKDLGNIIENERLPIQKVQIVAEGRNIYSYLVGTLMCTQGPDIDECSSNPCQEGGTCIDLEYDFQCQCKTGFTGMTCTIDVNECLSDPCINGATCVDLPGKFFCVCVPGYTGAVCEQNIKECESSPCEEHSSCVDEINAYRCLCQIGFVGQACEIDVDECQSSPCENGGTCTQDIGLYTCTCQDPYDGINCELEKDFCASEPCQNGGSCVSVLGAYGCVCPAGYSGDDCQIDIDECADVPCDNSGLCTDGVDSFTCTCLLGYTGITCETDLDECMNAPCEHGAECVDGASSYECLCLSGYTGAECQIDTDECESSPCTDHGDCINQVDGYLCSCNPGFTGPMCATEINECASNPCENGGTCKDELNGFTCSCLAGYAGDTCTLDRYGGDTCTLVKIDGQWSGWTSWGDCSNQCGPGVELRTRKCTNPVPQNGGLPCDGSMTESRDCESYDCANVNGNWGLWSEWSPCSSTCGPGTKTRTRQCNKPKPTGNCQPCVGSDTSQTYCSRDQCGLPELKTCGEWEEWTACINTCGDGMRYRARLCTYASPDSTDIDDEINKYEYEHEHCEDIPCSDMRCYHCEGILDYKRDRMTCKGPHKVCPKDQPYCIYSFSHNTEGDILLEKGCANKDQCSKNTTEMCTLLQDLTISSIISDYPYHNGPLEPHKDTIQMVLEMADKCDICCTKSRCNKGMVLPGNTVLTGGGDTLRIVFFTMWLSLFVNFMNFIVV